MLDIAIKVLAIVALTEATILLGLMILDIFVSIIEWLKQLHRNE